MTRKPLPRRKIVADRQKTYFKEWRKYRELTLEEAAELAGMTAGNLSAMERRAQGYTQSGLEALAAAYDCTPAMLLEVDPNKGNAIWTLWEKAKPSQRQQLVEIAATLVGKSGSGS